MIGKIIFFDNRLVTKRRKNKGEDNKSSASSSDRRRARFERGRASQGTARRKG